MHAEAAQIKNFIDGRFVEAIEAGISTTLNRADKPYSQVADSSLTATFLGRAL